MREFRNLGQLLLFLVLLPLFLLILIIAVPIAIVQEQSRKRKLKQALNQLDYSCFFIYSTGKAKARIVEQQVLPDLLPGIKPVRFNGAAYESFFPEVVTQQLINPKGKGYPQIGKIEEGKITLKSLKNEFKTLVLKEKNVHTFNALLQDELDSLYHDNKST